MFKFAGKAILWVKNHAPGSEYAQNLEEVTKELVESELETIKQRRALLARSANEQKVLNVLTRSTFDFIFLMLHLSFVD